MSLWWLLYLGAPQRSQISYSVNGHMIFKNAKIVPKSAFFRYYLVLLKKLNNGKENKDITQWCVNPKQKSSIYNCSILG